MISKTVLLLLLLSPWVLSQPSNSTKNQISTPTSATLDDFEYNITTLQPDKERAKEPFEADQEASKSIFPFKKLFKLISLKPLLKVLLKIRIVLNKFWTLVLEFVWKPLLKLYFKPLRFIHSYLLPELINAECFDVYHGFVHRYQDPSKPFRPNKLELVKCIVQYLSHYFRSWIFVNRIEQNDYNLE